MEEVSYGLVKYQYDRAHRIDVDEFPRKQDGFQYTAASYLAMMQDAKTHHEPDGVDYWKIVNDHHLIDRVMGSEIDEVWLFGAPYFGYWELHMVGKGAIWCNSSPLANSGRCARRFVIMGFNYERGVARDGPRHGASDGIHHGVCIQFVRRTPERLQFGESRRPSAGGPGEVHESQK